MTGLDQAYPVPKPNKYNAKKTIGAGKLRYDSKLEGRVGQNLFLDQDDGKIKDLRHQVPVLLTDAEVQYIADFKYCDTPTDEPVWVEAKGLETAPWRIKRRLWKYYGPGKLLVYKAYMDGTPFLFETIIPRKRKT